MLTPMSKILVWLARQVGQTWTTGLDSETQALYKDAVNTAYFEICQSHVWPQLKKRGTITLTAPYDAGTCDATQGSATVGGNLTTWAANYVGRYMIIGTSSTLYRITAFASTTSITVSPPFVDSDATAQTYHIVKSVYDLPPDFGFFLSKNLNLVSQKPMSFISNADADEADMGRGTSIGIPTKYRQAPSTGETYHSCAVTISANTITGTGFTAIMDGMVCRLDGEERKYQFNYSSATAGTLTPTYVNPLLGTSTNANSTILRIRPEATQQIEFYPHPHLAAGEVKVVEFEYQRIPPSLLYISGVKDDVPLLSEYAHEAVQQWSKWLLLRDVLNADPTQAQIAEGAARGALSRGLSRSRFSNDDSGGFQLARQYSQRKF